MIRRNPRYACCITAVFGAVIFYTYSGIYSAIEMPAPVAHWKLNENIGTIATDFIGGHTGSLQGDPTWQSDSGRIGGALQLDGNGDYVNCGNDPSFNIEEQITISAWIKVNAFDTIWQAIITKGDTAWRLHRWSNDHDSLSWNCNGLDGLDDGKLRGHIPVNDGQWHHVAGVYDGQRMHLYVDGVLDNSGPATGLININNEPFISGKIRSGRIENGMDGLMICAFIM